MSKQRIIRVPPNVKFHILGEQFDEAIHLLEPNATAGDADAQFLLGYLYFGGADVDAGWARGWLKKAAAQDHAEAVYYVATWPETGDWFGFPATDEQMDLLHKAAELGSSAAQYLLGAYYSTGEHGLPKDGAIGRRYYAMAAENGNLDAQYNLGTMYLDGEGGEINVERGLALLIQAASRNDLASMSTAAARFLAEIYRAGAFGINANPAEADRWERREAELETIPFRGHPDWFWTE